MAKRKKQQSNDFMSKAMDTELGRLEKDIASLYSNVQKEISAEFQKFTDTFKKEYDANRIKVAEGRMTQEEFSLWTQRKTLQSDLYKSTIDSVSKTLVKADQAAMAVVNGRLPSVVAQSYNFVQALGYEAAQKAGISAGTFQVYNARSVQSLMKGDKNVLKPKVDVTEDMRWNHDKINKAIATSIAKGDSIPDVAKRLQGVTNMDRNSAVRNARTAMTSAENLGRSEAADDLKEKGIPVEEVWSATYDNRTRDTHLMLDGTVRDENGVFGADFLAHPLRYPADPEGDPEEIYNCRCRLNIQLKGIDHSNDEELYKQFMQENHPEDWENLQSNDHYQDMQAEKEAALDRKEALLEERKTQETSDNSSGDFTEIPAKPERPSKDDFDDYDKYLEARDAYREERKEWENQRDDYIQKMKDDTEPMTREELNEWAEKRGIEIIENTDYKDIGSINDVDPQLLRIMTDRCGELLDEFPQVLDYRQHFMEQNGMEGTYRFSIGYSSRDDFMADGGIGFLFGRDGRDFDTYAATHYDSVSEGHLVNGTGDLRAIIDHEFGHNVQATIATFNGKNESEIGREFAKRVIGLDGKSDYSKTNDDELFAEAFCAWKGGNKTSLAKEMGKFLKEYKMR